MTDRFRADDSFPGGEPVVLPHQGQWFGLDELDRQLFTQLAEITSTFEAHASKIWGFGFRPELRPTLLVRLEGLAIAQHAGVQGDRRYGYALNVDDIAALGHSAQLVPLPKDLGLPPVYRFGAELVDAIGLTAEEPAQFAIDVADQECLALSYDSKEAHASSREFARFFVHESFHQYQMFEMAWRVPVGYDPSLPWINDPIDAEMANREMLFLETFVAENSGPSRIGGPAESVTNFLRLRAERQARRPDLIALEQGHEQIEGSARFVENTYSLLNGRELRLPIPTGADLDPEEFASIGRYYRTGARVLELLDRTQVPWRHRLPKGDDPVSILIDVLETKAMSQALWAPIGEPINLTRVIDIRGSDALVAASHEASETSDAAA